MSRIGRMPIAIPSGVEVKIDGNRVRVKGPKGELQRELHPEMKITVEGEEILVTRPSDEKKHRALHGLTRTLIYNMVEGVTKGFSKGLELSGVGCRAAKQGNKLVLTVGYSQPVELEPEPGLEIEVPAPNKIIVKGPDKERVGAFAAKVRAVRKRSLTKAKASSMKMKLSGARQVRPGSKNSLLFVLGKGVKSACLNLLIRKQCVLKNGCASEKRFTGRENAHVSVYFAAADISTPRSLTIQRAILWWPFLPWSRL